MALIRRIVQSSENLFLSRTNPLMHKINGNFEFASRVKKSDLPTPPKKPLSAYMIFCQEQRKDVKKENPNLTSPEQIKLLAEKWSALSIDLKRPYEVSARENTVSYGEAHKKFYESLSEDQKEEMARLKSERRESRRLLKLRKALKESGLPKPVFSSYALFIQSQAGNKEGDTKSAADFIKHCAEKWKTLSDAEKKDLEDKVVASKKQYILNMEEWRKRMIAEGKTDLLKEYDALKGKGNIDLLEVQSSRVPKGKKEAGKKRGMKKSESAKN